MKLKHFQIFNVIIFLSCFQKFFAEDLTISNKASAAAKQWLLSKNYHESEFSIKTRCKKSHCEISIFSSDHKGSDVSIRGCLARYCLTMQYDIKLNKITDVVHIR
tara:strand:- start:395 stop:709 length:315 start_codon:yes stop_codon:yes gene_type:complete